MQKRLLLILLSAVFVSLCYSQSKERLGDNLFIKKLSNGLDILVIEDHSVPLATIVVTFKAGAFTETKEINGLTGLYQLMTTKGNKEYANQQDFNYHSGQLGIRLSNCITTEDYSTHYFTLPSSNLEPGLNFMNSAIRFASINRDELEKEKAIVSDNINQKKSKAIFFLSDAMIHHLWGDLYTRQTALGNREVIDAATPEQLIAVRDKYFYPNNAILIIGGDVEHSTVFKQVEKVYGDWAPSKFDPFKKWPVPEFKPLDKPDYFIVDSKLSQTPVISVYWQGPETRNDINATYAADVFSYAINQNSSRLTTALVQSGLASSATFSYFTLKYGAPISLTVIPQPTKVKECLDEIKKQIALMDNEDYISDEQIETAKRMLEINGQRQEDITTDFVHTLSFWWACASLNYYSGYYTNLNKVSKADIKKYVQKYIKNHPYCAGLLINPELRADIKADDFFKPGN